MSGSGSKPGKNQGSVSDVKKAGDGSAAPTKGAVETEPESVVKSTSDSSSGKDKKIKEGEDSRTNNRANGSDMDVDMKEQGDGENLVDGDHDFRVGDFVWVKLKNHPWWPGQIYDSSDASDYALKHIQKNRILVANFGDGACSWCLPTQLKPFVENFKEMSTDTSPICFLKAIQSAVDEIGRIAESEMICKCIPLENRVGLSRPMAENGGVKSGVRVPEVDIGRLSLPEYAPSEVLAEVMSFAKNFSVDSLFELGILRSWISAFYRARGGYQLPVYREPLRTEGLEDENKNVTKILNDFSVPIKVPILGPQGEDGPSSPAANTAKSSDDEIYHRRKQKSVAEIMGENSDKKTKSRKRATSVKEEKESGKSASSSKKRGRKRKLELSESDNTPKEKDSNPESTVSEGTRSKKRKRIEVTVPENTSDEAKEESEIVRSSRGKKKSRFLSPPNTDPKSKMGNSSFQMESESDKSSKINQVAEQMMKAASDEKQPIGLLLKELQTSIDTTFVNVSDVNMPVSEFLSEVQFAAVDHLYLRKKGSLDPFRAFVFALRSSICLQGENYKSFHKWERGRKRKSVKPSRLQNQENEEKSKSANKKTSKADKLEGKPSPCLILTFNPVFPLPSKEDIVTMFSKFGSLNEEETEVLSDSHEVLIIYMKGSDTEAAYKSSFSENPFGRENCRFWLHHSSLPDTKAPESRPVIFSPSKWVPEKLESSSQQTEDYLKDVKVIRRKLEITTTILENYHLKFSEEDKSILKGEMKLLMDVVETVSEKVRVMAENVSY